MIAKKKYLLIFLVLCLVLTGCKKKNNEENNKPTETIATRIEKYKGFNFEVPDNIDFDGSQAYTFTLTGDTWAAEVQIYYDKEHQINKYPEKYYQTLKDMLYDVEKPVKVKVNGDEYVTFKRHGDIKSIIFTSLFQGNFSYEIDYYNSDNDYNYNHIDKVIDIMKKAIYRIDDHEVFFYKNISNAYKYYDEHKDDNKEE